jgi:hypothetical protein
MAKIPAAAAQAMTSCFFMENPSPASADARRSSL